MKYFDIKRDNQIIKQGGFFCEACLTGKPRDDMSPDQRYCIEYYAVLKETKSPEIPESWSHDNQVFILGGKGYCINPDGRTVCIGSVDDRGKPVEAVSDAPYRRCEAISGVSKLDPVCYPSENTKHPTLASKTESSFETKKHPGGRPRKNGNISRVTEWRRSKELHKIDK